MKAEMLSADSHGLRLKAILVSNIIPFGGRLMTQVRRRVLRPLREPSVDPRQAARLESLRQKLDRERASLDRWMTKLKRAFHAVERGQLRAARLEKQLSACSAD